MTIIWMFATYPRNNYINGRSTVCWVCKPELEKNIKTLLQSHPNTEVEALAKRLLALLNLEPLATKHMSAYLAKLGYRAANRVYKQLSSYAQSTQLDKHDVCQIAWSISSDPANFFTNFDPQRPIENYAYKKIEGKIKEEIFRLGIGTRNRSDWGLLRSSTRKYLQEALQNQGYSQPRFECNLLAWFCFKEVYASQRPSGHSSLPAPTSKQFGEMVNLYNQLVESHQQINLGTANQAKMRNWLQECIQALRGYPIRYHRSLDDPSGENENSPTLSETIVDHKSAPPWEQLEMQESLEQFLAVWPKCQAQLDENSNNYLLLRYGFNLDYRSIAPIFENHYLTVRYHCNKATQQILKRVAEWAETKLSVTPDSETLKEIQAVLKPCLTQHYQDLIFQSVFRQAWQQLNQQEQDMLYLRYFRQMEEVNIAQQLQLCESVVTNGLASGSQRLAEALKDWMQNRLNVSPDLLNSMTPRLVALIGELIANHLDCYFV